MVPGASRFGNGRGFSGPAPPEVAHIGHRHSRQLHGLGHGPAGTRGGILEERMSITEEYAVIIDGTEVGTVWAASRREAGRRASEAFPQAGTFRLFRTGRWG